MRQHRAIAANRQMPGPLRHFVTHHAKTEWSHLEQREGSAFCTRSGNSKFLVVPARPGHRTHAALLGMTLLSRPGVSPTGMETGEYSNAKREQIACAADG